MLRLFFVQTFCAEASTLLLESQSFSTTTNNKTIPLMVSCSIVTITVYNSPPAKYSVHLRGQLRKAKGPVHCYALWTFCGVNQCEDGEKLLHSGLL